MSGELDRGHFLLQKLCHVFSLWYSIFMLTIFGLGNPEEEHEKNRHNTGRMILDYIAKANDFSDWKNDIKIKSNRAKGEINGEKVELIQPNTFMNNSGLAAAHIFDDKKKLKSLVVVYDDMDLPLGKLKISFNRSSGGHNGVESIIKKVKSQEFLRIRVGVSPVTPTGKLKKPSGEEAVIKLLLGNFKEDEMKVIKKISKEVSEIIGVIGKDGKEKAMSLYN